MDTEVLTTINLSEDTALSCGCPTDTKEVLVGWGYLELPTGRILYVYKDGTMRHKTCGKESHPC